MNELRQPDAPAAQADPDRPFFLEAHSYSDGLRIKALGRAAERPAWAPSPEHVGFRNEVTLRPADYVVEFARFLHRGERVTWIGLFKRAVDEILGDRQNHAGVGLWLLDHDVLYAEQLLAMLQRFVDAIGSGEKPDEAADGFIQGHLPRYLQRSPNLPGPLAGWPFSQSRISDSATFVAAAPGADEAWLLAADQLLRATLLPPPRPGTARALILVRQTAAEDPKAEAGTIISPLAMPEIVKALPHAFESAQKQSLAATAEAQAAIELGRHREAELADARTKHAQLEQQIRELHHEADQLRAELQASDPDRERAMLHDALRNLSQQVTGVKTTLHAGHNQLLDEVGSIKRRLDPDRLPAGAHAQGGSRGSSNMLSQASRTPKALVIVAAVTFLVILTALLIIYWPGAGAAPDPDIQYRAGPLDPDR